MRNVLSGKRRGNNRKNSIGMRSKAKRDDSSLVRAAAKLSEGVFKKVWDNPDDDVYDRL